MPEPKKEDEDDEAFLRSLVRTSGRPIEPSCFRRRADFATSVLSGKRWRRVGSTFLPALAISQ
jgi:hypothetical protein